MELNKNETLIAQLAMLLEADGEVSENEKKLLSAVAIKLKIDDNRIIEILSHLGDLQFNYPSIEQARAENLYTLFMMINSDGKITKEEKDLIVALGVGLGFRDKMIMELVDRSIISNASLSVKDFVAALSRYN